MGMPCRQADSGQAGTHAFQKGAVDTKGWKVESERAQGCPLGEGREHGTWGRAALREILRKLNEGGEARNARPAWEKWGLSGMVSDAEG